MIEEIRTELQKLKTARDDLQKFGITMAVVLGLLSALAWYKEIASFPYLLGLAIIFLGLGLLAPTLLKQVYRYWMTLAIILGSIMTKVILSLLFYTAITLVGLISGISNKDRLNQNFETQAESYWIPYKRPKDMKRHLEKQF
ncbi:hypothetical protein CSA56_04000 [candidate division KSB3 bacterium]|uniref:SxtJ n=1 Tax=candidate division KSB3 bacterium TaxID=2044937 RepID=A0A2G6KIN3_9BACT|nr:MAG: hypothetical protein CSA56_04000 [candidate division KSB3 bacterium]